MTTNRVDRVFLSLFPPSPSPPKASAAEHDGQRMFAQVMNEAIDDFVQSPAMKVDWIHRQSVVDHLRQWVEECFVPAVTEGLRSLTGNSSLRVTPNELSDWQNAALDRLAKQRIRNLLDYVKAWPHSTGAILDLKVCDSLKVPLAGKTINNCPFRSTCIHQRARYYPRPRSHNS